MAGDQARNPQAALCHRHGERRAFCSCGIWENWKRPGSEDWVRTFAIITTNSNELVSAIHDRMPVIIAPEEYTRWLSTLDPDPRDLLVPYAAELMAMWPISTRVNKPDNNDASILDRLVLSD